MTYSTGWGATVNMFRRRRAGKARTPAVMPSLAAAVVGARPQGAAEAEPGHKPPKRDWVVLVLSSLSGLAAVGGLVFTGLSLGGQLQATQQQLGISQQGEVTDRYNAAIANLGSRSSVDIRLGGIYALQRLAKDSPRDQPTIVAVLCAFARDQDRATTGGKGLSAITRVRTDVQAAITVVGNRDTARDGPTTLIDLDHTALAGAQLTSLRLASSNLTSADLTDADLNDADLTRADMADANLSGANLVNTDLREADLGGAELSDTHPVDADLSGANLSNANLTGAVLAGLNLSGASFAHANLTNAVLAGEDLQHVSFATANLTGTVLSGADLSHGYLVAGVLAGTSAVDAKLTGADLTGADLARADIRSSNLSDANLSYANLAGVKGFGVNLSGADLDGADLAGADLVGAKLAGANLQDANLEGTRWPLAVPVPAGWRRNPGTGNLERAGR